MSESKPFYPLVPEVDHVTLGMYSESRNPIEGATNNLRRIGVVRAVIKEKIPDVIISFIGKTNIVTILSARFLKIPVLISERNNPNEYSMSRIWRLLRTLFYPLAKRVVVQTPTIKNFFPKYLRKKIIVIPNPVILPQSLKSDKFESDLNRPAIVAAGSLHPQKGFDILLRAFAKIANDYPDWTLTIFGEGSCREQLEILRNRLHLTNRVFFPGLIPDIYRALFNADLFVLSSRYEGFPNVLCEAMACGLPVIATDCPTGPVDIIRHEINGLLIQKENAEAMAAAIARLISDRDERERIGIEARKIVHCLSIDRITDQWKKLICQSLN